MSKTSSNSDEGASKRRSGLSRRGVLQATGAGLAGAGLTYSTGSAKAAGINLPPLVRDGNQIVDPQGEQVTLRGVSIADPGEASRCWRGMDSQAVFDMATSHEDWGNTMVRLPMQAEFIYSGSIGADTETPPCELWADLGPEPEDLPHGDDWGPALPGTYGESQLEDYLEAFIDPIVDQAADNGAYLMLDYHRHYPVFHHEEHNNYVTGFTEFENRDGVDVADVWDCPSSADVDHSALDNDDYPTLPNGDRYEGPCGERGPLWHGADQKDEILDLVSDQEPWEHFDGRDEAPAGMDYSFESIDDVYLEDDAVCHAFDNELSLFWEVVSDRYADEEHVIWDVYNEPTGPYAGDWGGAQRPAGALSEPPETDEDAFELFGQYAKPYYDLWRQRSQPWMDIVENHGQGQVATIGNPQWSQYVYWAPYNEHDYENMAYTSHVYLQENARPLEKTVGEPSEQVPVFFSEFGWMDFDLTVPTPWMTLEDQAGIEYGVGDANGEDPTGSLAFGPFIEEYDVHPVCWAFDLAWEPNFFEHGTPGQPDGAKDVEHWYDEGYLIEEETPGQWWQEFVNDKTSEADYNPNDGSSPYPDADTSRNVLDGADASQTGYAAGEGTPEPTDPCDAYGADGEQLDNGDWVCDLEGDGHYRDLTASGDTTTQDLQHFFERQHRDPWNSRTDLFDFTGNNDVGQPDVVDLFHSI